MTRKRFIKLMMADGFSRNQARDIAKLVRTAVEKKAVLVILAEKTGEEER